MATVAWAVHYAHQRGILHRDLETICLKCLDKEPRRRYGSAEALAEDLERWRAGEPIRARATGRGERLWRWGRRNPLVAGLSVAVVLLAALGFVGVLGQWQVAVANEHQANAHAVQANQQRDEAQRQRDEARALAEQLRRTGPVGNVVSGAEVGVCQITW